jgi:hypothetical protein
MGIEMRSNTTTMERSDSNDGETPIQISVLVTSPPLIMCIVH